MIFVYHNHISTKIRKNENLDFVILTLKTVSIIILQGDCYIIHISLYEYTYTSLY